MHKMQELERITALAKSYMKLGNRKKTAAESEKEEKDIEKEET